MIVGSRTQRSVRRLYAPFDLCVMRAVIVSKNDAQLSKFDVGDRFTKIP